MLEVNDILSFMRYGFPSDLVQIGMSVQAIKKRFGTEKSAIKEDEDFAKLSDGLSGEFYRENGWIALYSNYPDIGRG
jgi:hypothetical protein